MISRWKEWKEIPETEECLNLLKDMVKNRSLDLVNIDKEDFDKEAGRIKGIREAIFEIENLFEKEE